MVFSTICSEHMGCFRSCLRLLVTMMALSFFVVPQVSMTKVELNANLPITDSLIKLCPHRNFILVLECNVTETYFLQWSISHIEPITYTPDSSYMPIFENEDKYIFLCDLTDRHTHTQTDTTTTVTLWRMRTDG